MPTNVRRFQFDGGAATYWGTAVLAFLVTVCTLGICYPFGLVLMQRWKAKHSYIDGRPLVFTGSAMGLFGHWIKWFLLCIITVGIYSFWVAPRIQQWVWENTDFADSASGYQPHPASAHMGQSAPGFVQPAGAPVPPQYGPPPQFGQPQR